MAAVSLLCNTNMAAVTSCKNVLFCQKRRVFPSGFEQQESPRARSLYKWGPYQIFQSQGVPTKESSFLFQIMILLSRFKSLIVRKMGTGRLTCSWKTYRHGILRIICLLRKVFTACLYFCVRTVQKSSRFVPYKGSQAEQCSFQGFSPHMI